VGREHLSKKVWFIFEPFEPLSEKVFLRMRMCFGKKLATAPKRRKEEVSHP
jgi:hypothetical protein